MSRFVCGDNSDFVSYYVKEGYVRMDTKPTIQYTRCDGQEVSITADAYEMCIVNDHTLTVMYTAVTAGVIDITPMSAIINLEFRSIERSNDNETKQG